MKIIDLSHTINTAMSFYPGAHIPVVKRIHHVADDGFNELELHLSTHSGTHLDCPFHMDQHGLKLDELPLSMFTGPAFVIDCSTCDRRIERGHLLPHQHEIERCQFVLLHTGWSAKWGHPDYLKDYPVLTQDAAEWLCRFNLNGIGMDTISPDEVGSSDFPIHKLILGHKHIIIENMNNLDKLIGINHFRLYALPLPLNNADGSPIRAIAILE